MEFFLFFPLFNLEKSGKRGKLSLIGLQDPFYRKKQHKHIITKRKTEGKNMRFGKMLFVGAAAFAMVLGTVGCATDDESLEKFRIKEEEKSSNLNGKTDLNGGNVNDASADLESINGKGGNTGVSEWENSAALNPYDDFGTPITGLSFQPVYFRFDQSSIDSAEYTKLDQVASYIMSNPGTGVVIEGNCDSKGSDEYNRALGERRALAAKEYLLEKGIADSRIRTVSYGEEKPAVPNTDDSSRAKNRRDEFVGVTLKK